MDRVRNERSFLHQSAKLFGQWGCPGGGIPTQTPRDKIPSVLLHRRVSTGTKFVGRSRTRDSRRNGREESCPRRWGQPGGPAVTVGTEQSSCCRHWRASLSILFAPPPDRLINSIAGTFRRPQPAPPYPPQTPPSLPAASAMSGTHRGWRDIAGGRRAHARLLTPTLNTAPSTLGDAIPNRKPDRKLRLPLRSSTGGRRPMD